MIKLQEFLLNEINELKKEHKIKIKQRENGHVFSTGTFFDLSKRIDILQNFILQTEHETMTPYLRDLIFKYLNDNDIDNEFLYSKISKLEEEKRCISLIELNELIKL